MKTPTDETHKFQPITPERATALATGIGHSIRGILTSGLERMARVRAKVSDPAQQCEVGQKD